ncbi:DUF262 domain-containing protein [Pseudomonas sp. TWP3-1]|uniref:DUF262 domain-containing protein n=1 Tax=Pseudomonas sp. TWP3-1 TaxID=2804631 RepID=UPI003CFBA750
MQPNDPTLRHFGEVLEHYSFLIPDYQRGYSWGESQWQALWRDIQNVARSGAEQHFAGMMLVRPCTQKKGPPRVEVVDGQQRLITVIILANALRTCLGEAPQDFAVEFKGNKELQDYFDFYALGNADAESSLSREPSSYALSLKAAAVFYGDLVTQLPNAEAQQVLDILLDKFCVFLLAVSPAFDIHIAFETLNNRGRPLSKMELLKNRLIYLSTVVAQPGDNAADLRNLVHEAWKGIYQALGRSEKTQHHDDEFLLAHATAYFKRKREADWLENTLFNDVFTVGNEQTTFAFIQEYIQSLQSAAQWWSHIHSPTLMPSGHQKQLDRLEHCGFAFFKPLILSAYLRASSGIRGAIVSPREHARALSCVETLLAEIERFIVVVLRLSGVRGNTGRADMESAAYTLLKPGRDGFLAEENGIHKLKNHEAIELTSRFVRASASNVEYEDGSFDDDEFPWEGFFYPSQLQAHIERRFQKGDGFYKWDFTRLALYEYETSFQNDGNNPVKIPWSDFHFDETVEHIFPQNPSGAGRAYWDEKFSVDGRSDRQGRIIKALQNSLGNLLFLSRASNSAASNDAYSIKQGRSETGKRMRYTNASYSATEVAQSFREWNAQSIAVRGVALLKFIEQRWDIELTDTPDDLKSYLPLCFGSQGQAIKEGKAGKISTRSLRMKQAN